MDELLQKLLETPGVAGREDPIRNLVAQRMAPYVQDLSVDPMGNLIGFRRGRATRPFKLLLAAHMDQIGFYVRQVDDTTGFCHLVPVGGFDPRTLAAQRVLVHGRKPLPGVIGLKPIHVLSEEDRKKPVKIEDLSVDLGLPPGEVKALVQPGDPVTLWRPPAMVGNCYSGPGLDDRIGLYVLLRVVERVAVQGHPADLYCVATVQEEVGLRGALTASFGIDPQVGLALDVTLACDQPGVPSKDRGARLGGGVAIGILNRSVISHARLVEKLRDLAEREDVPFQMDILPKGGTDAASLQRARAGCAVATVSVPCRYVHSTVELVHRQDVEAAIRLVSAYVASAAEPPSYSLPEELQRNTRR